jgi:hypothetical protein
MTFGDIHPGPRRVPEGLHVEGSGFFPQISLAFIEVTDNHTLIARPGWSGRARCGVREPLLARAHTYRLNLLAMLVRAAGTAPLRTVT